LSLDQHGAAPQPASIQDMANILLSERSPSNIQCHVGNDWVYNFIKRHKDLKTRYSQRYNYECAKCEDLKVIHEWFECVQTAIQQYRILDDDIYNFDETGFAMGLIATAKVVTRAETSGCPPLLQPGNQEWVTLIESVNSAGWALPPCIIFKGKAQLQAWYKNDTLLHDWRIEISPNGWTTDEIGMSWLQNLFIPYTNNQTKGKYWMLVLDGHGSHLTPQFDCTCTQNHIIPICMPPHCYGPCHTKAG